MSSDYIAKEISWLSFNGRLLQEAMDPMVPLIERLKFLGIYSSNMDEFFEVRVATLSRLAQLGKKSLSLIPVDPRETLKEVHQLVLSQQTQFKEIYNHLVEELRKQQVFFLNEKTITPAQKETLTHYFHTHVRPHIFPLMVNSRTEIPELVHRAIYLAVIMRKKPTSVSKDYCIIRIPSHILQRFVPLPREGEKQYLIMLDDVIRLGLEEIFRPFLYTSFEAYCFKISRDAELDIKDDISASYLEQIKESLHRRKLGDLVRMVYDRTMPNQLLTLLVRKLKLTSETLIETNRRYHNSKDYITFPSLLPSQTTLYPEPVVPRRLVPGKSYFDILDEGDVLLNFPYQSFDHVIDFLREAAIDPKVTEIKINLYRLGKHSSVINALINAGKNRKKVVILLELQARFDEKANIHWANVLKEEGIKVIFGVPGLKVHSKVCMITRMKKEISKTYCLIGSGNFNEDTARFYTDAFLLTANKQIAKDVRNLFAFFGKNYKLETFEQLLVSPFTFRKKIIKLIRNEIQCAQKGKSAYIDLKLNNLADREIIALLYEASQAGVKIRLAVRGMFSLVTGLEEKSENIEGRGLVDKYLEHSRIFFFGNEGDELCFISSADLLPRNLDSRVEVTCPILDEQIHQELRDIFEQVWADNVKSRILNAKLDNTYFRKGKKKVRSQESIYKYLKMKHQG